MTINHWLLDNGMMSFGLKRILLIFGVALSLFLVASVVFDHAQPASATDSTPVYAATNPVYAWPGEGMWDNIKNKISGLWSGITCTTNVACWIRQATTSILNYGLYAMIGTDVLEIAQAETFEDAFANGYGLVGSTAMAIGTVYDNPAEIHLASFVKRKLSNNLLASPAYATVGTGILHPIEGMWEVMRSIAYAAFVVVVAAIALMIILRKQIAPRVVVTVTHAIPKIFFSLILITLSFPIAALFIDLFIVWLPAVIVDRLVIPDIPDLRDLSTAFTGIADEGQEAFAVFFSNFGRIMALATLQTVGVIGSALTTMIVAVLMAVASIFVFGFVFFQLVYRYARIMILTVLSPLILLLGALPGQEGATSGWLKDLAVNTLTFPAIMFVLILAVVVLASSMTTPLQALGEIPTIGTAFFATGSTIVLPFVSLIIFLLSFKIPGIIENAIKGRARR